MTPSEGPLAALTALGLAAVVLGDDARILEANVPFGALVARARGRDDAGPAAEAAAVLGQRLASVFPMGGEELTRRCVPHRAAGGAQHAAGGDERPADGPVRLTTANGAPAVAVTPRLHDGPAGRVVVFLDVSDLTQELDALRRSEKQFRMICEAAPVAIFLTDAEFNTLYNNPANLTQMGLGPDENVGTAWQRALHPDDRERVFRGVDEKLRRGEIYQGENRYLRRDGSVVWVKVKATPVFDEGRLLGIMGLASDITAEKRLEEELLQAQKLESVGRLAGGVAHDFNNLLTVILGHASMARPLTPEGSRLRDDLAAIEEAATRATTLTRQLLTFARRHHFEPRPLDVNELTADMGVILRRLLGTQVELVTLFEPAIGIVRVDPAQLEQVLSNLASNAADAMPDGGTFTLETSNVDIEGRSSSPDGVPPGQYVLIAATDTGVGIAPEVLPHIFEPFFSTKATARATGLGLSACYGIITQAGGHIRVESHPGEGTTVRIFLPRVEEGASVRPEPRSLPSLEAITILLVEDEPRVRAMAGRTLREAGYRVVEASDGLEALRVAAELPGPLHLLVTDVVMPKLGGRALAEQLAGTRPDLHVLFVSGYTGDAFGDGPPPVKYAAFLSKPYVPSMLLSRVRATLEGRR